MHTCTECRTSFSTDARDQAYYTKMQVSEPQHCPDCRLQRRLAFRNEHNLYKDRCDLCNKDIVSIFSPDKPYTVYCATCYWGDGWNPMDYGFEFDFDRPFFEQFKKLYHKVPHIALITIGGGNVNSPYTHDTYRLKDCYFVFDGEQAQNSYYGETVVKVKDCAEFLHLEGSELCYECVNCSNCYDVSFSRFSKDCANSAFLIDCIGVKKSLGCANLIHKEHYIFNEPHSKQEYLDKSRAFLLTTYAGIENFKKIFEEFQLQFPKPAIRGTHLENVTGDNLKECKDTFDSFDCGGLRDCRYCTNMVLGATDCYDVDIWGDATSHIYNSAGIGAGANNVIGSYYVFINVSNILYSAFCSGSSNLLGCAGLRKKQYCIFNTQYSKEDYESLRDRLVAHMRATGEYGQFFPNDLSLFAYNETVANLYFPLSHEQVLERGYRWLNQPSPPKTSGIEQLPNAIADAPQSICDAAFVCNTCQRAYKIIPQELRLLRQLNIPLPRRCFYCRHKARLSLRNPRKLWERKCAKCKAAITTTYAPERPETVLCKECYLQTVY